MPNTQTIKISKGGEMRILPMPHIETANLKGGGAKATKKGKGRAGRPKGAKNKVQRVLLPSEMEEIERKQYISALTPDQLDKLDRQQIMQGRAERAQLSTTQDALLAEILSKIQSGGSIDNNKHSRYMASVKNKNRLQYLIDMGVDVEKYSPMLIKAAVDGDQRNSYLKDHDREFKMLVRDSMLQGVRPSMVGFQTRFGTAIRHAMNGDQVAIPQPVIQKANVPISTIGEGRQIDNQFKRLDKQQVIDEIIDRTHQIGNSQAAVDMLYAYKSMFTQQEFDRLFKYTQDNSIALA
jgi:hypothetical protein